MPPRLREIVKAVKQFDVEIEKPKSGSHWKARREGYQMYPIPAHNGLKTEIPDKYIAGMCRALGIDEAELRELL